MVIPANIYYAYSLLFSRMYVFMSDKIIFPREMISEKMLTKENNFLFSSDATLYFPIGLGRISGQFEISQISGIRPKKYPAQPYFLMFMLFSWLFLKIHNLFLCRFSTQLNILCIIYWVRRAVSNEDL